MYILYIFAAPVCSLPRSLSLPPSLPPSLLALVAMTITITLTLTLTIFISISLLLYIPPQSDTDLSKQGMEVEQKLGELREESMKMSVEAEEFSDRRTALKTKIEVLKRRLEEARAAKFG
jgi:hypothetical protein